MIETKASLREAILSAAMQLFSSCGFDGTSFRQITALSGAARPLILYHFKSKEELWQRALEEISQRFNAEMSARMKLPPDISDRERARAAIRAFVESLIAVPAYGQVLLREGCSPGPRLDWIVENFAPPVALDVRFQDKRVDRRVRRSILRDILSATLLGVATLGPLYEASLAAALHTKSAGIYPLTDSKLEELTEMMLTLIFAD
jgi:AcrR family transcriptional regulator